jgi:hypothetical protein
MMAQAAADKLFEMTVAVRKLKKDKLSKLEEESKEAEAKAAAEGHVHVKSETDMDFVDGLIYLPDYPSSRSEHLALSSYGQNVNCFFEVFQVQENPDGTAPADLKTAKEVAVSKEEAESEHFMKFMENIASLKNAISVSAKNAPIRNCGVFRIPYCDVELVDIRHNEDGEPATNTLTAE